MRHELPFDPFPCLSDPHYQTIFGAFLGSFCAISHYFFYRSAEKKHVSLSDGDKLVLEIKTPKAWKSTDPTILLVHGLCGSSRSPNVLRVAKKLYKEGYRCVSFNMRGCGPGKGYSKNIYHSGRSEDVFEALKTLKEELPDSPIILIGYSLGGNIVLKLAGELGEIGNNFLKGLIAASPPVDLSVSSQLFGSPENAFYEKYFIHLLCDEVDDRHRQFKDLPSVQLSKDLKMHEFDQLYTVPEGGFKDVKDYYHSCSSIHVIGDIRVPCKIIFAEDDPIISSTCLDAKELPGHIEIYKTKKGGHLGYLGNPFSRQKLLWLDHLIFDWVDSFDL